MLQQDVRALFHKTGLNFECVNFYTSEEINEGCRLGPSISFADAADPEWSEELDCRLLVTPELLESMLPELTNLELAQAVDCYLDYLSQLETSWMVDCPISETVGGGHRNNSQLAFSKMKVVLGPRVV